MAKNISKKVPNGTIVRTRDEFFANSKGYTKPGKANTGNYRGAVVVDSNQKDELALIKLTTSNKGRPVANTKKSKFRNYIEIYDDNGNPIKEGKKFKVVRGKRGVIKKSIDQKSANQMKKQAIRNPAKDISGLTNKDKLKKLKGR